MKKLLKTKANIRLLEDLVRSLSKGYYSDFNENNPDHTDPDEINDHSQEDEKNDHFNSIGNVSDLIELISSK